MEMDAQLRNNILDLIDIRIDKLASMVRQGFEETATRGSIEVVTNRLDGIDYWMDKMSSRIDKVENRIFHSHEKRFRMIEDDIQLIKTRLDM